jgi:hypothetical protein
MDQTVAAAQTIVDAAQAELNDIIAREKEAGRLTARSSRAWSDGLTTVIAARKALAKLTDQPTGRRRK